jgi:Hsp70 protein
MLGGIGLSVGATTLRGVAIGRSAVTRSPVLTRYPRRPPEVGVPSENPNLGERGLIITDFVDRVGDPVAIVAGDGSSHRAETLTADALRALLYAVTGGRPPTDPVGVTHPAHWHRAAIDALRGALATVPEFGGAQPALVISDALAALTALQDDPGLPTRGIIALCDVGGTGTSITLADAANGFQPVGPTVRHVDLSGDLIDQALLTRVLSDLATTGVLDLSSTSAIGSLGRLRSQCRAAKERLSTAAVTSLTVELPGRRTEVRINRTELDDAIRVPLDGFVGVLQDIVQRNGIRPNDLVAIASVGGGARIPALTTTLSEHLRVPVITSAQPELAAAIGGGRRAVRGLVPDGATAMVPAAPVAPLAPVAVAVPPVHSDQLAPSAPRALAWSDADDIPEPASAGPSDPRPRLEFAEHEADDVAVVPLPWYRRPLGIALIGLTAVVAAAFGATLYALRSDESPAPASTLTPVTTTTVPGSQPTSEPAPPSTPPPPAQAPPTQTVFEQAPPPPVVTVTEEPTVTQAPPPPSTEVPPPPPETTPPPSETPPSSSRPPLIPTIPPIPTIPGLPPFIPQPGQWARP